MHLTEDILHFVWKNGLFDQDDLKTTDNQKIEIINRGFHNHNSGPDFSEAKIKIGGTLWAGQVEIHVRSGDWYLHGHQNDKAYDNVILHVVYFDDKPVEIHQKKIATLVLNNRIKPILFSRYKSLIQNENEILCGDSFKSVDEGIKISQLERSVVERLTLKSGAVLKELAICNSDWDEMVFRLILKNMVGRVNEIPAEWLLKDVTLKKMREFGNNQWQKEALLLGTAGFLNDPLDEYSKKLKKEFNHQKSKYSIQEMNLAAWKYGKMRPAQFPSFRLVQMAALVSKNHFLFTGLISYSTGDIHLLFENIAPETYWEEHYVPGKKSVKHASKLGAMQKDLLVINVMVPVLFAYGDYLSEEKFKERAINLLMSVRPEQNAIIKRWKNNGAKIQSAFDSQGYLELYKNSCIRKKCLTCRIGTNVLKS